jgi:peroxiredoxin
MARRLHLPFAVLSDGEFRLAAALGLPRFELAGRTFFKRVTLIVRGGRIEHVFYPVFPPDKNADAVIQYLRQHRVPPGSA